ncbi:MAG: dephospho-CoA kinase [Myxococcota bacterium]
MIVGLTGGIATGKSTVGSELTRLGQTVIDADQVSRDIVSPGSEALDLIAARFGAHILNTDGSLNREALGTIVFSDKSARESLEQITHPRIRAEIANRVREAFINGAEIVFVEAALLVETGSAALYPCLWVVSCDADTQIDRLIARKGCDAITAKKWIAAQMNMEEKIQHATTVIDNNGSIEDLHEEVALALSRLRAQLKDQD